MILKKNLFNHNSLFVSHFLNTSMCPISLHITSEAIEHRSWYWFGNTMIYKSLFVIFHIKVVQNCFIWGYPNLQQPNRWKWVDHYILVVFLIQEFPESRIDGSKRWTNRFSFLGFNKIKMDSIFVYFFPGFPLDKNRAYICLFYSWDPIR